VAAAAAAAAAAEECIRRTAYSDAADSSTYKILAGGWHADHAAAEAHCAVVGAIVIPKGGCCHVGLGWW